MYMAQKTCGDGKNGQKPQQERVPLLLLGYMKVLGARFQELRSQVLLESKGGLDALLAKGGEYDN